MTTHTPGPWNVSSNMYGVGNLLVAGVTASNAEPIANCGIGKTGEANARLIAAAPDLLTALIRLEEGIRLWMSKSVSEDDMQAARAAIAKATGGAE